MSYRRLACAAVLFLASCKPATSPSGVSAPAPPGGTGSPGRDCVEAANALPRKRVDEPIAVTVKHLLVKHKDAERADAAVTRGREEACVRALEAVRKLKQGVDFDEVVAAFSDEAGAATRGGMLGEIRREEVEPAFADHAFVLEIDQVSTVVETKFGFHVILRVQ